MKGQLHVPTALPQGKIPVVLRSGGTGVRLDAVVKTPLTKKTSIRNFEICSPIWTTLRTRSLCMCCSALVTVVRTGAGMAVLPYGSKIKYICACDMTFRKVSSAKEKFVHYVTE